MPLTVVSRPGGSAVGAAQVVVPPTVGLTEAAAREALTDFTVRARKVEAAGTAGTVLAQDPAKDAIRPRRSQVTIFLIVTPKPDDEDVVDALQDLTDAVDALGNIVETEQAAQGRNDVVLQRLQEIKDTLPSGGSAPEAGESKSSGA